MQFFNKNETNNKIITYTVIKPVKNNIIADIIKKINKNFQLLLTKFL